MIEIKLFKTSGVWIVFVYRGPKAGMYWSFDSKKEALEKITQLKGSTYGR